MLGGEGDVSRRPGALAVAGLHRTPVGGVWSEAGQCEQLHLGSGLGEEGRGGRAGEGVVCDDAIPLSHGWRLPGDIDSSLSSICCKHQRMSSRGYCNKIIIQITKTNTHNYEES